MFLDPKSAVLICLVGILFGVVILHVCLLLSEKSENLFSFEGQLTVRQQCSKATPTPAGSGKRARRTRRKKLWNHQKRAVIYESNEHHTTPEIQLEYPCQRYCVTLCYKKLVITCKQLLYCTNSNHQTSVSVGAKRPMQKEVAGS